MKNVKTLFCIFPFRSTCTIFVDYKLKNMESATTGQMPPVTGRLIEFKPVTIDDLPAIRSILQSCPVEETGRTCDFTVAGIYMWVDFFNYQYCIVDGTLFIKGVTEDDVTRPAFSLPVGGKMSLHEAISLLEGYCTHHGMPLRFSAVPECRVPDMCRERDFVVEELVDWADYLYPAEQLATLSGKAMNKKRNHVNRFMAENPDYAFEPIQAGNLVEVEAFMAEYGRETGDGGETAAFERKQVADLLEHYDTYGFDGSLLRDEQGEIVAFTIGEILADTLYVHIEKMRHDITGAGETINKLFAEAMLQKYGISHINREEDVGDEGLRHAKLSYHPESLLKKYNLTYADR